MQSKTLNRKKIVRDKLTGISSPGSNDTDMLLKLAAAAFFALVLSFMLITASGCSAPTSASETAAGKRVIVLGMDGMDPKVVRMLWEKKGPIFDILRTHGSEEINNWLEGRQLLPNLKRLAEMGNFTPLTTSMPPQSPVAWSNFITGMNAGGHGVSNFVQRNPEDYKPRFSIAETQEANLVLELGDLIIPISGGDVFSLRKGEPFWRYLTDQGITAQVIKIPVNFPPDEYATKALSGMGTPDILGGYGEFHYFTSSLLESYPNISGGDVYYVDVIDNKVETELIGPKNSFFKQKQRTAEDPYINDVKVPFTVYLDPEPNKNRIARFDIQGKSFILKEGEFSDWIELDFEMLPLLGNIKGICRFYLKQVSPYFRLYVSPINLDPMAPAMPISHPGDYAKELAMEIGLYWTKGLPADTKALDMHVFSDGEYLKQARLILDERMRMFENEWEQFDNGFFFFYFSSTDQDMHMLWRAIDPEHPLHAEALAKGDLADDVAHMVWVYQEVDKAVGKVLDEMGDDDLLMVMSDHGFASFAKEFHLNAWLRRNGYLVLKREAAGKSVASIIYDDVDWSRTKAYGIGTNGLYINLKGREGQGIVEPSEVEALSAELVRKLEAELDPENSRHIVSKLFRKEEIYSGLEMDSIADFLVGYNTGYRCSGSSALGDIGREVLTINPNMWSGDHSMDYRLVPGVLFTNRQLRIQNPALTDLPVTILKEFNITKPEQMIGRPIF